jgi:tetratricopeptide (TPR) repeat protein
VHADDETTFVSDYKTIAKNLMIPTDLDGDELLTAVRDRIEALGPYVLVLDNADNLTIFGVGRGRAAGGEITADRMARNLFGFVPRHSGTVLWTSRDKRISGSLVGAQRAINVARMTDSEAMSLLETVGSRKIGKGELDDAAQLLAELEWLPLAVSQAAAYIRRMSTTLREYLSKLARHRKRRKVLRESEFDRHRRPGLSNSILETWDISMEQIRRENEMAYDILHVLAFLDSQNIPLEIMIKMATLRSEKLIDNRQGGESTRSVSSGSDSEDDDDEVLHAATRLQEFSFLHLRASEGTSRVYEMHKLVQEATQCALSRRDRRKDEVYFSKLALRVVTDLFPERRRELWGECEKYVAHAQRAGEWAGLCEGEIEASSLLTRVSGYLYDRGRWREKEPVDKRAYEFRQKKLGARHPDTIGSMASLAATYGQQGRYEEAKKIQVEVLALRRDVLGERHPDTITSMANLAATYYRQGRYEETEKIYVEVLALRRDVLGEKHHDMIGSMADLATTYHEQGRYEEAEKIQVEVLALRRDVLGERHPDTIRNMANLAATYGQQGRYEEAEKIYVEVLALQRDVLGEKHPDTIWSMANLAATYGQQGRYEETEKIQVEVLALRRDVLGERHPDTIRSMASLAATYYRQGRYEETEKIQVEVLALRRDGLGEKHPDTLQAMHDLAVTWNRLQRRPTALALMQECFQRQCEVLGQTHPST